MNRILSSFLILLFFVGINYSCSEKKDNRAEFKISRRPVATLNSNNHVSKHEVVIKAMKYYPEELNVSVGDTIIWVNQDIYTHNVVEIDSAWFSPLLNPGDKWMHIITSNDIYYCSLHSVMRGAIVLTD